ncbi:MAG: diphthine--ammonia ligase [Thermoplasmata archaeon]|jgi:ABC transporter with metal-binding/Fe-S-binding domain ATP-binding protein
MKETRVNMEGISLISGGKDSLFSTFLAMEQGIELKRILTIIPERFSMMYHFPNVELVEYIGKAMNLEHRTFRISDNPEDLLFVLSKFDEKVIVSGAIESEYQKNRLDMVSSELGKIHYAPLWRKNPETIIKNIIELGLRAIIVGVFAEGLDENFLGREINYETLDDLISLKRKYGIHICGEGGEYETFVFDAPFFNYRIEIVEYEKIWNKDHGIMNIKRVRLQKK